jgi:NADPH2:quinone reductase
VTDNISATIGAIATDGVDIYLDNVGGPITDSVLGHLSLRSRVVVCGQIALYNEEDTPMGPRHFWKLIRNRARIEGFLVSDYSNRFEEATTALGQWLNDGSLEYRETITTGLENAPDAFIGLFEGENIGKQLVQIPE